MESWRLGKALPGVAEGQAQSEPTLLRLRMEASWLSLSLTLTAKA